VTKALSLRSPSGSELKASMPGAKSLHRPPPVRSSFQSVSTLRGGRLVQEVFARKIFADRNETHPLSAIQITTAAGICAAVDLFRQGRLPQRGFIRQEEVALPDFLDNRFGRAYQQSRQVESIG